MWRRPTRLQRHFRANYSDFILHRRVQMLNISLKMGKFLEPTGPFAPPRPVLRSTEVDGGFLLPVSG